MCRPSHSCMRCSSPRSSRLRSSRTRKCPSQQLCTSRSATPPKKLRESCWDRKNAQSLTNPARMSFCSLRIEQASGRCLEQTSLDAPCKQKKLESRHVRPVDAYQSQKELSLSSHCLGFRLRSSHFQTKPRPRESTSGRATVVCLPKFRPWYLALLRPAIVDGRLRRALGSTRPAGLAWRCCGESENESVGKGRSADLWLH